ncbi:glycosyltransferase family 4 protein [Streptomyces sp. NPDC087263]|uniref:glycosyltransferase family 4 protein n=1 Tax=Streptomyces sp. NPDC087263 TaxID=3365773 RepID=UPI003801E724
MRVTFLIHNGYGVGGTIRTTCNLSGALAELGHDVEVVSVFRHLRTPRFTYDKRVRLRHLVDSDKKSAGYEGGLPEFALPSADFPRGDHRYPEYSALTDRRIAEFLADLDTDVIVGTRPGLNVQIARQAPATIIRVGQEHLSLGAHKQRLKLTLRRDYRRLDAVTTTTRADAEAYRRQMWLPGVRVTALPNSVPDPGLAPADCSAPQIVAVGRTAPVKRYPDLIRAFAQVAERRPDWGLRICGVGPQDRELKSLVGELGLADKVTFLGNVTPVEPVMAKASILVMSSRMESFGMSLVEAMRVGLPVVSTDCPHGPREIITHGVDGLLVPPGDIDALAGALLELIDDEPRRRRMGRAGLLKGARYDPEPIAEQCAALFQELLDARATGPTAPPQPATVLLRATAHTAAELAGVTATRARRVPGALRRRLSARLGRPSKGQQATVRDSE